MIHKRMEYRRMQERRARARLRWIADRVAWSNGKGELGIYVKDGKYGETYCVRVGKCKASPVLKRSSAKVNRRRVVEADECAPDQKALYRREFDYWWTMY